mgnify:CR=1 FL=1
MWYQVSEEQASIICGSLRQRQTQIERDIKRGVEYPFFTMPDMIRELSQVMELVEKFTDDGTLNIPVGLRDNMLKW